MLFGQCEPVCQKNNTNHLGDATMKAHLVFLWPVIILLNLACAENEPTSFYEIPFSCPSATSIGCGSHSKPVLLALGKSPSIKEAWLNRAGTTIAVVWENVNLPDSANAIFSRFNIAFHELSGEEIEQARSSFSNKKDWYKGAGVDQLTREEAGILADKAISPLKSLGILNDQDIEAKMREEITAIFKADLLAHNPYAKSDSAETDSIAQKIFAIGEKYLGEGKMPYVEIRRPKHHQH